MFTRALLSALLFLFVCFTVHAQPSLSLTDELQFSSRELRGDILFIGGYHGVHNSKGEFTTAKQNHDFTGYIPIDGRSDSGYVIVNHELIENDPILGDGGGMTVFTVWRQPASGRWTVVDDPKGKYRSVDFSGVGGTLDNCGGFQTPWGTVMTAEEEISRGNSAIYRGGSGILDTSDYTVTNFNGQPVSVSIPKYQNYGWMVEVDVKNARAIRKNYNMGLYNHEGGAVLPDGRTVILTDDTKPGFLFKFVAHQSYDFSKGQLYVYRQGEGGIGGEWLELPMDLASMIDVRRIAAELGATVLIRTEWAIHYNGKVYITETGEDDTGSELPKALDKGAELAAHLVPLDASDGSADGRIHDYYGRILELDVKSNNLRVYLEGGAGDNQHFANPDCIAFTRVNGKPVIMINEDLNGFSHGRVPAAYNEKINEIFCLDLSKTEPGVDDLVRMAVGPRGCETTGGRFTPDGSTYFVNVQHPKSENRFPFNNSVTVAVRSVDKWIAAHVLGESLIHDSDNGPVYTRDKSFQFDKKKSYQVFNQEGESVLKGKGRVLEFYGLQRGTYTLLLDDQLQPLIIR